MQHTAPRLPYWIEWDERGERLVLPVRVKGWQVAGLIAAAAFGAGTHYLQLHTGDEDIWAGLLTATAVVALVMSIVQAINSLFGRETVQVVGGDLIHGWELFGLRREKRYALREMRGLTFGTASDDDNKDSIPSPLTMLGKTGAVMFGYGDRIVRIGATLDEDHAEQVVRWIARRAPQSVVDY